MTNPQQPASFPSDNDTERALRESEARFRSIVEGAPDAIFIQTEGKFAYLNPAACRLFGIALPDELVGTLVLDRVHPDYRDKARERIRRLNEDRARVANLLEQRFLRMDGSEVWVETVGEPILHGGKAGALVFVRDVSSRKEAERRIAESEYFFRLLADTAPVGIAITDKDGRFAHVNRHFVLITGYTREDVPTVEEWFTRAYPDERERARIRAEWNAEIRRARDTGADIGPVEYPVRCRDGTVKNIEFRMAGAEDVNYVVLSDVTRRRQAEDAMHSSAAKLEAALASMRDAVFISDTEGNFINLNEAFATFHKFRNKDECATTLSAYPDFLDVFLPDGRLAPLEQWAVPRALRGETATNAEYSLRRKDTGERWVGSYSFAPIRDESGAIVGSVVVGRDVTERKEAEKALRESEDRFRALVDSAPDGIFVQDDNRFLFLNHAMVALLGARTAADVLGTDLMARIAPESRDAVRARIRHVDDTGDRAAPMEEEYLRLDGARVPVETVAVPLRYQGRDAHLVFVRDVSARRKAERERENLRAQLLQAQKMESVGRLAGGVAHDFNNILTVQRGYCEILRRGREPEDPVTRGLQQIDRCAERAASLTRQLLAFSRKQALQPRVFDMNSLVADMDRMLRRLIGEDIDLLTVPAAQPAMVKADPGQVEQVLINLAVNARDAMPDGGKLTIQVSPIELDAAYAESHVGVVPGPHVMLALSDTGVGMDEETRSRIFEPFFTTKGEGKGTGLGLSTVYGIVHQSGGSIWVYSEPGKGATFKVYLPRVPDEATAPAREAPVVSRGRGQMVLVVEDEEPLRDLAKLIIEGLGYRVTAAASGGAALALVEEQGLRPEVILTDMVMPGMNGRVLAERLQRAAPESKVIYMSGYTDDAVVHHGMLDSEIAFLQKPFTVAALAAKLQAVLAGS